MRGSEFVLALVVMIVGISAWELVPPAGSPVSSPRASAADVPTPSKVFTGYATVSVAGIVATFGGAGFRGDPTTGLSGSVVAITATADGRGYWLATSTGDILNYGDAVSYGSATVTTANGPITAMAVTRNGKGYWLVSSSGQVSSFGDAVSYPAAAGQTVSGSVVAIAVTSDGRGFLLLASDGGIYAFGDASSKGSDVNPAEPPNEPSDFTDADPAVVGVTYLASGPQRSSSGAVRITYFGDSLAWLDEIYSSTDAASYDESVADAATPGCGIAGGEELRTTKSGIIDPPAACSDWYQRLEQALASEHPDVVVVQLGYWESQAHVWDGTWETLTDESGYAAAVRSNLASVVALIESAGAVPILLTSPYYGDGTANAEVDAWNSIVRSTATATNANVLDLNSLLDPAGAFETSLDGIVVRTSDGVHLTQAGVNQVIDPWLLPVVERLGLSTR